MYIENIVIKQPNERYGQWIEHNFDETKDRLDYELPYECSECHGRQGIYKFNYCPNCGAKMKGGILNES